MSEVILDQITKTYPNGVTAVNALSLDIADGEFLVLVGPSGCGKSTALRMIAGLEDITSGELRIHDIVVNNVAPKDRDIAMVFQNYALYPHMTVRDNIAFALKLAKVDRSEIDARVGEAARVLELTGYLDRKPAQLSGGQRQRVAMGRAIVRRPSAFLMDEPLSNLDAKLRVQTRAEIARIQDDLGVTTVYVTHDQVEAMTMADRVAILNFGVLQQVDTPARVYDHPNNAFVAAFIGSPAMNLVEGEVRAAGDGLEVVLGEQTLPVPASVRSARPALADHAGRPVIVGIRPEDLEDRAIVNGDRPALRAPVQLVESLGAEQMVHLSFEAPPARVADPDQLEGIGLVGDDEDARSMLVGRFSPQSRVRQGETIDVSVDAERLHFFDIESGEAIWG